MVQHHLETFLASAEEADLSGSAVPRWVERDFRACLRCGVVAHGFARVRCEDCGQEMSARGVYHEMVQRQSEAQGREAYSAWE